MSIVYILIGVIGIFNGYIVGKKALIADKISFLSILIAIIVAIICAFYFEWWTLFSVMGIWLITSWIGNALVHKQ
jgi:hypothetical protein